MNELFEFAARLIELEGGAVEPNESGVHALLPDPLVAAWQVGEELALAAGELGDSPRLAYGSELLERMIETATRELPIAWCRLELAVPRIAQVRAAAEHFRLRNGVVNAGEVRIGPQQRLWLDALATLHGDEKRELLATGVVSARSGTEVEAFARADIGLSLLQGPSPVPPEEGAVSAALRACARRAEASAEGFRASMARRFERDRQRIGGYFEDLLAELDKRAKRGRVDSGAIDEKRRALVADRGAKLDALAARFVLRIEVLPIALRMIEVQGAFVTFMLRRRKANRTVELEFDTVSRKLVPLPCDGCGEAAPKPAACDEVMHLLCETCAPRAEGRLACPACRQLARQGSAALSFGDRSRVQRARA